MRRVIATCVTTLLLTACSKTAAPRPVIVQGAMDVEVNTLAHALQNVTQETIHGFTFWSGTLDGYPVVVSKTLKGMENAAAATALAAEHFHPRAIINQGTAGGHDPALHAYDIVVATVAVNLGSFKTGYRKSGEGSDFSGWTPLDLTRTDGSASLDPNAQRMRRFPADPDLLAAARAVRDRYRKGRVVEGVIGSSEVWNSEIDRIARLHTEFGTTAEEMEAAAVAQIAALFDIPFLGIRVLSNNITNGDGYNPTTGEACQEYVAEVVKAYAAAAVKGK